MKKIEKILVGFNEQFRWTPEIQNKEKLGAYEGYVLCGMGGSHLSADILKVVAPDVPLLVHRSYGLPRAGDIPTGNILYIASSYSGNTEEVEDFLKEALATKKDCAIIAAGGALIKTATEKSLPFIQLPSNDIQPRHALGFALVALSALCRPALLNTLLELADVLDSSSYKAEGERIASTIKGTVPIIYASHIFSSLAYNWKIKCNETAKIPAFANVFPELNHNELEGFGSLATNVKSDRPFSFILLSDAEAPERMQKRMAITGEILRTHDSQVIEVPLRGETVLEKIFGSLLTADWMTLALAESAGVDAEAVPTIEGFKKKLAS